MEIEKTKLRWSEIHYLFLESLFTSFTLFMFGILEIFFTIRDDVWFDFAHIGVLVLFIFICSFLICFILELLCYILSFPIFSWIWVILFALTLAAYIQGNFLFSDFGSLNGGRIDWSAFKVSNAISITMWLSVLVLALFIRYKIGDKKFKRGTSVVMRCILLVQLITLGTLIFTTDALKIKNDTVVTANAEFLYSTDKNMIVLMLDHYDSRAFDYVLNNPEGVDYNNMFQDFTYYPNTIGAFSMTQCALPHILTGEKYLGKDDFNEFINNAYLKSPLFKRLQKEQYTIQLFINAAAPNQKEAYSMVKNFIGAEGNRIEVSSKRRMLTYLCKLMGFRYLPQPLKQYCWFYTDDLLDIRDIPDAKPYYWENDVFDKDLQSMSTDAAKKMFNFYHLSGTHSPHMKIDEDGNQTIVEGRWGEVMDARSALTVVKDYLEKLKSNDVYDNSIIIIMADHGGDFEFENEINFRRENPLLLIKGFEEKHEFQRTDAPISYDDLQDAYEALLDGKTGKDVFKAQEGDVRERSFIEEETFSQYTTTGHAFDYDAMKPKE